MTETLRIAFYKSNPHGHLVDKVITWWTRGTYSHVEIFFPYGGCFSSSGRDGGTRFKTIEFKEDRWDFYSIEITRKQLYDLLDWCRAEEGKKYDYRGIFGFVWGARSNHQNKWYCSEIVSRGLEHIGVLSAPNRISPQALGEILEKSPDWTLEG